MHITINNVYLPLEFYCRICYIMDRKREAIEAALPLTMSKLYGFYNLTVVTIGR